MSTKNEAQAPRIVGEIEEILIPAAAGPRFDGIPAAALREASLALQRCCDGPKYNMKQMLRGAAVELRPLILAGRADDDIAHDCVNYVMGEKPELTPFEKETAAWVEAEIRCRKDFRSLADGNGLSAEPETALCIYPLKDLVATNEDAARNQACDELMKSGVDRYLASWAVNHLSEMVHERLVNTLIPAMQYLRPLMLSGRPLSAIVAGFEAYGSAVGLSNDPHAVNVENIIEPLNEREVGVMHLAESVIAQRRALFVFRSAADALGLHLPDEETIDLDRLRKALKAA